MNRRTRQQARKCRRLASPRVELLEDRWLLSTFTVTNNFDTGPGSLRQAIVNANATSGTDTINFNIRVGDISEVAIPTPNSGPQGIAAGPDGNLWFTQQRSDQIGRITPSGTITEFGVPSNSRPAGITAGPGGNLWFTQPGTDQIGRIT